MAGVFEEGFVTLIYGIPCLTDYATGKIILWPEKFLDELPLAKKANTKIIEEGLQELSEEQVDLLIGSEPCNLTGDNRDLLGLVRLKGVTYPNEDGTSRQENIARMHMNEPVELMREPNNIYDSNAILVVDRDGNGLGYIPRDRTRQIASLIDSGVKLEVTVHKVLGGDEGMNYGLVIRLSGHGEDQTDRFCAQCYREVKGSQRFCSVGCYEFWIERFESEEGAV